jgi:WD40 repeat protein
VLGRFWFGPASETDGYDAFISYSHAVDGRLAPELQKAIGRVAKPFYKTRALKVFRDRTNLSASPELWPTLEAALTRSRFLVLLASPEAARSKWIHREVMHWLDSGRVGRLLIVVTDGDLVWDDTARQFDAQRATACPPALLTAFGSEPNWVDLRWVRDVDHLSMNDPRFKEAALDLAAPMRGLSKDALAGEDVRQRRVRSRTAWSLVTVLAFLGTLAIIQSWRAQAALATAEERLRLLTLESARQSLFAGDPDTAREGAVEAVRLGADGEEAAVVASQADHLASTDLPVSDDIWSQVSAGWSRTNCLILTSAGDGAWVYRNDGNTLHLLRQFEGVGGEVDSVHALSDDCRTAAFGEGPGEAVVLEVDTGNTNRYEFENIGPLSAFVSPDGEWLIMAGEIQTYGFRARSGKDDFVLPAARRILWGPAGEVLLLPYEGSPGIWDLRRSKPSRRFDEASGAIGVAVSANWNTMLAWSTNRVWVFDFETGDLLASTDMVARNGSVSPNGTSFAIVGDGSTSVYTLTNEFSEACRQGQEDCRLSRLHTAAASGGDSPPSFSPDGDKLLVGGVPAAVYGADSGQPLFVAPYVGPYESRVAAFDSTGTRIVVVTPFHIGSGHDIVTVMQFGPRLITLQRPVIAASYGASHTLIVCDDSGWMVVDEDTQQALQTFSEPCDALQPSEDHSTFVVSHGWSFDLRDGRTAKSIGRGKIDANWRAAGNIVEIDVSPNGSDVLVAQEEGKTSLWRAEGGTLRAVWNTDIPRGVFPAAQSFSSDGRSILIAETTFSQGNAQQVRTLQRLDAATGAPIPANGDDPSDTSGFGVGTDISYQGLFVDNNGSDAWISDATSGDRIARLVGIRGEQRSVARSPDGKVLVTAGMDRVATLWRASDGARLGTLEGHYGAPTVLQYRPGGRGVLTVDGEGMLRVWRFAAPPFRQLPQAP